MSYFPEDIPYMTDDEMEEHGINAKRERGMERVVNEVIVNKLSIQLKKLGLIDEGINDVRNVLVDISKVCQEEQKNIDEAYQKGLTDAWEAARKIALMDTETSENVTGYFGLFRIMENLTPMQAIEKLEAYEEQKADEDVKRGDVVRNKINGLTYIVTLASEGGYVLLDNDGNFTTSCITNSFEKTGKHVDIDKILEAMKE